MAREARDERRRWLWEHSNRDRQRKCGRIPLGQVVPLTRRSGGGPASFGGLETCGSVWACPVCSAKVLAARSDELQRALAAWTATGGEVAMVTLTMRHRSDHSLALCWDSLSDAWAAASGRSRGVRTAKQAAGVEGWVRRVEATWGAANGWHLHAHALVFLRDPDHLTALGSAMFSAWALRLRRTGLTPVADQGGLDVKLLDQAQALEAVGDYVTKGAYSPETAALEMAGSGKLGRGGNLSPWQLLDVAAAGDRRSKALWHEWERTSKGRRALTWSQGIREKLGLDQEQDDDELAADDLGEVEIVAAWGSSDWPTVRDAPLEVRRRLLAVAGVDDLDYARDLVHQFCQIFDLPTPWVPPPPGPPT